MNTMKKKNLWFVWRCKPSRISFVYWLFSGGCLIRSQLNGRYECKVLQEKSIRGLNRLRCPVSFSTTSSVQRLNHIYCNEYMSSCFNTSVVCVSRRIVDKHLNLFSNGEPVGFKFGWRVQMKKWKWNEKKNENEKSCNKNKINKGNPNKM